MKDHACAAPGCTVVVPGYLLACRDHWLELPPELRAEVNRAWQHRRRHPNDQEAVGAHLNAVVDAMAAWTH